MRTDNTMNSTRYLKWLLPLTLLLMSVPGLAHPHVWVDYSAAAQVQGQKLVAVRETWTFSKGFPVAMVGDFSAMPKSGKLNDTYTAMFKVQAFSSLKGADYFTHVYVDGKPVRVAEARDFSVSMLDGHVVYSFIVPLLQQADIKRNHVTLGIYDESFFVDFSSTAALPVTLEGATGPCTGTMFDDHDHPIFFGSVFPQVSRLSC